MRFFFRPAIFAAASFVAVFGAFYAGPTRAWEVTAAPLASSSSHDAPAVLDDGGLSLNAVENVPAEALAEPAPVAEHAVASLPDAAEPAPARSLAELVAEYASAETAGAEHECLAGAVYFESKGEPLEGQLTVAEVVLNRSRSGRFPTSICGVVKQRGQFSFIRAGRFPPIARSSAAWRKAVAVAHIAMEDMADGAAPKALFFHARYVKPAWRGLTRVAAVGNHIFYR